MNDGFKISIHIEIFWDDDLMLSLGEKKLTGGQFLLQKETHYKNVIFLRNDMYTINLFQQTLV
jgi:hypothetical protein